VTTEPRTKVEEPLCCDRCTTELQPGTGTFYRVTIEAVADPTPPVLEQPEGDLRERIERLIAQMSDLSEREAMDQVHRRLTLYLCIPCYREWIEDPTG
jgi:hypothetical protein